MADVVVIDDDGALVRLVTHWLERDGHRVRGFLEADAEALDTAGGADAILLDLELGATSGLDLLKAFQERCAQVPVVMLTAHGEVPAVVEAMRLGAFDYLVKPVSRTRLSATVRNAVEQRRLHTAVRVGEAEQDGAYVGMIGRSPAMTELARRIERVAPTDVTVLVRGESGTGKELVAQALHARSRRAEGPFVAINCAAIASSLQESELFGHERGAYTGADGRRKGRFEQAHGGTLFLDEIAELTPDLQATLLRVLQERVLYRVGGNEEVRVDVRVVAASHRELAECVRAGTFREDLYYRLAVFEIDVPPLRARGDDVLLLARAFLAEGAAAMHRSDVPALSAEAEQRLRTHGWPGNVRELRNALMAACINAGARVEVEDLPRALRGPGAVPATVHAPSARPEPPLATTPWAAAPDEAAADPALMPMERLERDAIVGALERSRGNVSAVIRELGIPRTSLYRKLKKYGLRA